jgi:hypothetical protein
VVTWRVGESLKLKTMGFNICKQQWLQDNAMFVIGCIPLFRWSVVMILTSRSKTIREKLIVALWSGYPSSCTKSKVTRQVLSQINRPILRGFYYFLLQACWRREDCISRNVTYVKYSSWTVSEIASVLMNLWGTRLICRWFLVYWKWFTISAVGWNEVLWVWDPSVGADAFS